MPRRVGQAWAAVGAHQVSYWGSGTFIQHRQAILLSLAANAAPDRIHHLPWTHRTIQLVA